MKIKMLVELDYDQDLMFDPDREEARDWFFNEVLNNDVLTLWSNELGDEVGTIKILKMLDEE